MNILLKYSCAVLTVLGVRACGEAPVFSDPGEYIGWVENKENGICAVKKVGAYDFELQYKPHDYIILKDNPDSVFTGDEMKKAVSEIQDMQYFTFRISNDKKGDLLNNEATEMSEFSSRLSYFSSIMQNDIHLIEGGDTLNCLLFHFERSYGIDPRSTFIVGFPYKAKEGIQVGEPARDKIFLFDDHELGTGPVMIALKAEDLASIPKLNLD